MTTISETKTGAVLETESSRSRLKSRVITACVLCVGVGLFSIACVSWMRSCRTTSKCEGLPRDDRALAFFGEVATPLMGADASEVRRCLLREGAVLGAFQHPLVVNGTARLSDLLVAGFAAGRLRLESYDRAMDRIMASRVVVVGDVHTRYEPALFAANLIAVLTRRTTGNLFVLEALPAARTVAGSSLTDVRLTLRKAWPWPTLGTASAVATALEEGWTVAGAGVETGDESPMPPDSVADSERFPSGHVGDSHFRSRWAAVEGRIDSLVRSATDVEGGCETRVVVLCGLAHADSAAAASRRADGAQVRATIVLPILPEVQLEMLSLDPSGVKWAVSDDGVLIVSPPVVALLSRAASRVRDDVK